VISESPNFTFGFSNLVKSRKWLNFLYYIWLLELSWQPQDVSLIWSWHLGSRVQMSTAEIQSPLKLILLATT